MNMNRDKRKKSVLVISRLGEVLLVYRPEGHWLQAKEGSAINAMRGVVEIVCKEAEWLHDVVPHGYRDHGLGTAIY